MRIVQIIPTFGVGGAETMCEGLCRQLQKDGHEVFAVSLSGDRTMITDRMEQAGIPLFYLDKALGSGFQCVGQLKKLLRELHPQVIHTHLHALKYAALASRNIPIVHTVHNQAAQEAVFLDQQIGKYLFRRGKAQPVALTREVQQSVAELYGLPEAKIPVITNGIDLSRCGEKSDYALHYPVELLHVGRFFPQKNHEVLVQAAAILKKRGCNVRIRCCGDGPLLESIQKQVLEAGLSGHIVFEGVCGDILDRMTQADIFLLPSKWEGMPMTIIEAMGTGLPVVASKVGGVPDIITDGESGLLIPPTAEALTQAIERLVKDEALREHLGTQARQESRRFSIEAMAQGYEALYAHLTEGAAL